MDQFLFLKKSTREKRKLQVEKVVCILQELKVLLFCWLSGFRGTSIDIDSVNYFSGKSNHLVLSSILIAVQETSGRKIESLYKLYSMDLFIGLYLEGSLD